MPREVVEVTIATGQQETCRYGIGVLGGLIALRTPTSFVDEPGSLGPEAVLLDLEQSGIEGDSRPHFTQRIQRGNGRTGTPMLASADQTSTSSLFWNGGIRKFSTCAPSTFRTAASSLASWIGWQRSFSHRSMPSVTTDRLGRSINAPGP